MLRQNWDQSSYTRLGYDRRPAARKNQKKVIFFFLGEIRDLDKNCSQFRIKLVKFEWFFWSGTFRGPILRHSDSISDSHRCRCLYSMIIYRFECTSIQVMATGSLIIFSHFHAQAPEISAHKSRQCSELEPLQLAVSYYHWQDIPNYYWTAGTNLDREPTKFHRVVLWVFNKWPKIYCIYFNLNFIRVSYGLLN